MRRTLTALLALALGSCVTAGPAVVSQEEPVSIPAVPLPSGGAPTYFPDQEEYVGYPELGTFISAAVPVGDNLVLAGSTGTAIALDLTDGRRRTLAKGVLALAASPGVAWILRSTGSADNEVYPPAYEGFVVSSWAGDGLRDLPPISLPEKDAFHALIAVGAVPVLVLTRSVFTLTKAGDSWSETKLDAPIGRSSRGTAAIASTGELYVGSNLGEFGGGMQRVDLANGAVIDLCREPEERCDNVTAMVADPQHPGCVMAAEGLWHMASVRGRLVRVCRDRAEILMRRPLSDGQGIFGSEQFTGLLATPDGRVWVAGMGAVYEIDGDRKVRHPLPPLEPLYQLYVIRSLPGVTVLFDGAGVACGDMLRRHLAAGSALMPSADACGFMMDGWSPRLIATPGG